MPLLRRLILVASLVAGSMWLGAPHAQAAGCSPGEVTVVVDFGSLGGGTQIRCTSNPSSGLAALSGAGFGYGFRPGFPGMVCTINSSPDPCNGAPADAYWSYWHAPAGGGWTYATQGAGSRRPPPGSVEGWAFGAERRPSVAPPAPRSTTTTTPPTTRAPAPPTTAAPPPVSPASPASPDPAPTGGATASTEVPSTQVTADPTASTTSTAGAPERTDDPPTAELAIEPASSGGGGAGFGGMLGVAVVGAVGLAGLWEFRRRRPG